MHSVHTLRGALSAYTDARDSIMQLLLPFTEWDSTSGVRHLKLFRLRCSESFRLKCSESLTDLLIALYNSFA